MRKQTLILLLTLVLVVAFAGTAFAAQERLDGATNDGLDYYNATAKKVYDDTNGWENSFSAEDDTHYPYEIYLPNEGAPADYRIHSNYTKDTDACASCHATHTAVGASLLQWYTVYDTCMACHDGTVTTTYNVQEGLIGDTGAATLGGMFGTGTEGSLSNHNVKGNLNIAAAPGGSTVGQTYTVGHKSYTAWDTEFGCQSCHSPHGAGGNARILNPDVNAYSEANWGTFSTEMADATTAVVYDGTDKVYALQGYPYSTTVYDDGVEVESGYTLSNANGYTTISFDNAPGTVTVAAYPSLRVTMTVYGYLTADEDVTHESGMNEFCGACHTDYNTEDVDESGAVLSGTYSEAYRHKVGRGYSHPKAGLAFEGSGNTITCQTCHVAHGTSDDYWLRTIAATDSGTEFAGEVIGNLVEVAGSSALKRMPNMGTCEACHDKSAGAAGYSANTGQTDVTPDMQTADITAAGGGYIGQDTCAGCHGNTYDHFQETWHPQKTRPGVTEEVYEDILSVGEAAFDTATSRNGLYDAVVQTMVELGKATVNADGTKDYTAVNPDNIVTWSWGKNASRITARGTASLDSTFTSVYGMGTYDDRWIIVAASEEDAATGALSYETQSFGEYNCFNSCHTTGYSSINGNSSDLTVGWLEKVTAGDTPAFDIGVTCEACHGEGGNHATAPSAKNIINPATFTMTEQTIGVASSMLNADVGAKSCAKCHNGPGHQGDFYSSGEYVNHGHETLQDPNGDTAKYTASSHYTSGSVSCNTCHDMHEERGELGQLVTDSASQLCVSCHDTVLNLDTYMPKFIGSNARAHAFDGILYNDGVTPAIPDLPTDITPDTTR